MSRICYTCSPCLFLSFPFPLLIHLQVLTCMWVCFSLYVCVFLYFLAVFSSESKRFTRTGIKVMIGRCSRPRSSPSTENENYFRRQDTYAETRRHKLESSAGIRNEFGLSACLRISDIELTNSLLNQFDQVSCTYEFVVL